MWDSSEGRLTFVAVDNTRASARLSPLNSYTVRRHPEGSLIIQRQPPEFLYKYRGLTDHPEYLRESLTTGHVFFASPAGFNDSVDCRVVLTCSAERAEYRAYLDEILGHTAFSSVRRREIADEAMKKNPHSNEVLQRAIEEDLLAARQRLGVLCLSEYADDSLMWSRYGDLHAGLCLEFHVTEEFATYTGVPFCVAYDDQVIELAFPPPPTLIRVASRSCLPNRPTGGRRESGELSTSFADTASIHSRLIS